MTPCSPGGGHLVGTDGFDLVYSGSNLDPIQSEWHYLISATQEFSLISKHPTMSITLHRGCDRGQGEKYWARCLQYEIMDISFVNIKGDLYQYFLGLTPSTKVRKMKKKYALGIYITPLGL